MWVADILMSYVNIKTLVLGLMGIRSTEIGNLPIWLDIHIPFFFHEWLMKKYFYTIWCVQPIFFLWSCSWKFFVLFQLNRIWNGSEAELRFNILNSKMITLKFSISATGVCKRIGKNNTNAHIWSKWCVV